MNSGEFNAMRYPLIFVEVCRLLTVILNPATISSHFEPSSCRQSYSGTIYADILPVCVKQQSEPAAVD